MWTAGAGGACAYGRTRAARGCSAAVPRAGPTWRRAPRTASCCPWSVAAKHNRWPLLVRACAAGAARCIGSADIRTLYTLAQYSKELGLLTSYTRQTTSQARSASDRKSKSGITSWSWKRADEEMRVRQSIHTDTRWSVKHTDHAIVSRVKSSYQQVLLLTVNIGGADGIEGLVVFSNPPLSLRWTTNQVNNRRPARLFTLVKTRVWRGTCPPWFPLTCRFLPRKAWRKPLFPLPRSPRTLQRKTLRWVCFFCRSMRLLRVTDKNSKSRHDQRAGTSLTFFFLQTFNI